MIYFFWFAFSLAAGAVASNKTLGFWGGFLLSLLLSPLIGFIIVAASSSKQPKQTTTPQNTPSSIDELYKANELHKSGLITAEQLQEVVDKHAPKPKDEAHEQLMTDWDIVNAQRIRKEKQLGVYIAVFGAIAMFFVILLILYGK